MFYLWRMTPKDRWMAYDSDRIPPPPKDDMAFGEQIIPLPECQYYSEAKAEAERRNSARQDEAQGELFE